jgi:hypothetical protein
VSVEEEIIWHLVYLLPQEYTKVAYERYRQELIDKHGYFQFREWQRQAFRRIFGDKKLEGAQDGID